jgi:glutamate---cysteine ligase / carboxylate-amine ligase
MTRIPVPSRDLPLSVGIEEEYHLVDRGSGELVPAAATVLDHLDGAVFEEELQRSVVETHTTPHDDLGELRDDLVARRRDLVAAAGAEGLLLLASGTAPRSDWQHQRVTATDRYERLVREHGIVAEQQVVCGCHVHVGVPDQAEAVRAMAHVRPWLPALLALSASSPFWQGRDTGQASYRTAVWTRWPTAGPPPALADEDEFEQLVGQLLRTGAIIDRKQLYWFVRPSDALPTLEFRVADVCTTPDEAVLQAALCRALVATALDRSAATPAPAVHHVLLDVAVWRAARSGVGDELVDPVTAETVPARQLVDALLAEVTPALEAHGDLDLVERAVARIFAEGTSADRQRRAVAAADGDLSAAVALVARETDPAAG